MTKAALSLITLFIEMIWYSVWGIIKFIPYSIYLSCKDYEQKKIRRNAKIKN